MCANPFINDAESAQPEFELGEQANELCQSLATIGSCVETLKAMDRRYQDQILEGLKPVISADREGQGSYKAFVGMHENTQALQSGVKRLLDTIAVSSGRHFLNIEESDIRKLLEEISEEDAEEKFESLKKIQDGLAQYYQVFMKDRYENLNARGRIQNSADELTLKNNFLNLRVVEEERVLGIRDERISLVVKKYSARSSSFVETVSLLNSKTSRFEADNLRQMEENFKNFNRVVVVIKNTLGVEKKA